MGWVKTGVGRGGEGRVELRRGLGVGGRGHVCFGVGVGVGRAGVFFTSSFVVCSDWLGKGWGSGGGWGGLGWVRMAMICRVQVGRMLVKYDWRDVFGGPQQRSRAAIMGRDGGVVSRGRGVM